MSMVSCPVCGSSIVWKYEQTETLFTTSPDGDEQEEEYHYIRFECVMLVNTNGVHRRISDGGAER